MPGLNNTALEGACRMRRMPLGPQSRELERFVLCTSAKLPLSVLHRKCGSMCFGSEVIRIPQSCGGLVQASPLRCRPKVVACVHLAQLSLERIPERKERIRG
jgi:hypothetical protein